MKKIFLFLVCAATFVGTKAQVKYGVRAGANLSTFTGDASDAKSLIGFNAGVFAEFPIASSFSIHPELYYSGQGAKFSEEGEDFKYHVSYINLPVLAKYEFASSGFFAQTGPQIGFLMSAKAKEDGHTTDVKDNFKSIDFAWAFGIGYQLPMNLGIDARYNLGLANIADGEGNVKNSVFQLALFYTLGGGNMKK